MTASNPRATCDHGITLARYTERCAECGVEVVARPPKEAELRDALREAQEFLIRVAFGSFAPEAFKPEVRVLILRIEEML